MNNHLNDEQLIGYVYLTLTDAEREMMDDHLVACRQCRARLTRRETGQRMVHHNLRADITAVSPPPRMSFSRIAPRLKRRQPLVKLWQPIFSGAAATAAIAGLVMALFSLWEVIPQLPVARSAPAPSGPLPAMASLIFAFVVAGQFNWKSAVPTRSTLSAILAFVLWIGTAVVGLQIILIIWDIFIWSYLRLGGDFRSAAGLSGLVVIGLAILWIAAVIGGGEYHYRQIGQRSSWKLFAWTIGIELFILGLAFLV